MTKRNRHKVNYTEPEENDFFIEEATNKKTKKYNVSSKRKSPKRKENRIRENTNRISGDNIMQENIENQNILGDAIQNDNNVENIESNVDSIFESNVENNEPTVSPILTIISPNLNSDEIQEKTKKLPEILHNYITTLSKKTIYSKFKYDLLKKVYELKEDFNLNLAIFPFKALKEASKLDLNLIISILIQIFQSHLQNHENDSEISLRYQTLLNLTGYSKQSWERLIDLLTKQSTTKEEELTFILCDTLIRGLNQHDDLTSKELLELFVNLKSEDLKHIKMDHKLLNDETLLEYPDYLDLLETLVTTDPVINAYQFVLEKDYGVKCQDKSFIKEKNLEFVRSIERIKFCKFPKNSTIKSFMCFSKDIFLSDKLLENLHKSKNEYFHINIATLTMLLINEGMSYYLATHLNRNCLVNRNNRVINLLFGGYNLSQIQAKFIMNVENWFGTSDNFKLRLFQA